MIKRYLVAAAAAATLAGGAFAFAANLDVTSSTLASGSTTVDSDCDHITVDWSPAYDGTEHAYLIDDIVVTGGTDCIGEDIQVTIDRDALLADVTLDGEFVTNVVTFEDVDIDANDVLHVTAISTGVDVDPATP